VEDHRGQEEADAFSTTINRTGETTSLSGKVEIEIQSQEMFKDIRSHLPDCFLGNTSKDRIAEFLEHCGSNSSHTI
jgi:hypothetical protein